MDVLDNRVENFVSKGFYIFFFLVKVINVLRDVLFAFCSGLVIDKKRFIIYYIGLSSAVYRPEFNFLSTIPQKPLNRLCSILFWT
jgi:hypothetical protein